MIFEAKFHNFVGATIICYRFQSLGRGSTIMARYYASDTLFAANLVVFETFGKFCSLLHQQISLTSVSVT